MNVMGYRIKRNYINPFTRWRLMVQIYNTTVLISKYISVKTITNYKALVTFLSKKKEESDSNLSGFWIPFTLWDGIQPGCK